MVCGLWLVVASARVVYLIIWPRPWRGKGEREGGRNGDQSVPPRRQVMSFIRAVPVPVLGANAGHRVLGAKGRREVDRIVHATDIHAMPYLGMQHGVWSIKQRGMDGWDGWDG